MTPASKVDRKKVWVSWSTGKDSAYALHLLKKDPSFEVGALFTTVTESFARVSMHSTREALLYLQADRLGLPVEVVRIPDQCENEDYELQMTRLIAKANSQGVDLMAFGDLFLEDIRQYREKMLFGTGIEPIFPLWRRPTDFLAKEMIASGIRAYLTCIDPRKLDRSFVGREFNSALLGDLPRDVDPCGENGEFHTFVSDSPDFNSAIRVQKGDVIERDGFVFADIVKVE
ncbi:MAG: ATP-binding protein [Bdellovibrio sp.]|nr:MAG: ATP-binding protein [Bdellovibrio sp.]